ncbi:UPF0005-domain-containing protein [Ascodesmis nigricans]|uniref:UPF0005-domain-containing protein n=1 Tax=Ascodesmis nigricans TaxID=341454 RepID=A0A4S2MNV5_9PEZI|nr:UPF0005-domain-containing protein [Ascodesmis nigricans]
MADVKMQGTPLQHAQFDGAGSSSHAAPPPYQSGSDTSPLLGSPRSSDDNIPDDFKYSTSVSGATTDIRNAFIRKVYSILTVQLLLTAAVSSISFFSDSFRTWIQQNTWMVFVAFIGAMGTMFGAYWKRKSYPTNLLFLGGFTIMESYTVAVIVSFYEAPIVLQAVLITGLLFMGLTLWASQSKYDFISWYGGLYGVLWAVVIFGMMAMFFPYNKTVELVYSGVVAILFSIYILADTQMIMRQMHVEEEIAAAISLYLDIINLFLAILRILNSTSDN